MQEVCRRYAGGMYVYLLKRQTMVSLYSYKIIDPYYIYPSRYFPFGVPLRDKIDGCRRNSILLPTCVLETNYINIFGSRQRLYKQVNMNILTLKKLLLLLLFLLLLLLLTLLPNLPLCHNSLLATRWGIDKDRCTCIDRSFLNGAVPWCFQVTCVPLPCVVSNVATIVFPSSSSFILFRYSCCYCYYYCWCYSGISTVDVDYVVVVVDYCYW